MLQGTAGGVELFRASRKMARGDFEEIICRVRSS